MNYYLLKRSDIIFVNEINLKIRRVQNQGEPLVYLIPEENIYNRQRDIYYNVIVI